MQIWHFVSSIKWCYTSVAIVAHFSIIPDEPLTGTFSILGVLYEENQGILEGSQGQGFKQGLHVLLLQVLRGKPELRFFAIQESCRKV